MVQIVYSEEIIKNHSLSSSYLFFLNEVAHKDYPNTVFFSNKIKCLDLDLYEAHHNNGSPDNTMDAAIGIASCEHGHISNHRLALVELRMGYKNIDNLSWTIMRRKVTHSRELLDGTPLESKNYFIFTDKLAPQATNWFSRLANGGSIGKNCIAISVSEFNNLILFEENIQTSLINNPDDIKAVIQKYIDTNNWNKLIESTYYWMRKADSYKTIYYNPAEHESILKALWLVWETFLISSCKHCTEDEGLEMEIIQEELDNKIKILHSFH